MTTPSPSLVDAAHRFRNRLEQWERTWRATPEAGGRAIGVNADTLPSSAPDFHTPPESVSGIEPATIAGAPQPEAVASTPGTTTLPAPVAVPELAGDATESADVEQDSPTADVPAPAPDDEQVRWDAIDTELLPVMLEEMNDLIDPIDTAFADLVAGRAADVADLHRKVHTLKGVVGMVGATRTRTRIHDLESALEDALHKPGAWRVLRDAWRAAGTSLARLRAGPPSAAPRVEHAEGPSPAPAPPPRLRVDANLIDVLLGEARAAMAAHERWGRAALDVGIRVREAERTRQQIDSVLRDLGLDIDRQIRVRRLDYEQRGQALDPLEMDRYTRAQERVRRLVDLFNEDQAAQHRDLSRIVETQRPAHASQGRSLTALVDGLAQARRVPADHINDRLHKVVLQASRELGKPVRFLLRGGRTLIDRDILQRLVPPLEHILRNALAHGIEDAPARRAAGKPDEGNLTVSFAAAPESLRVTIGDDGAGLDEDRIRRRAEQRGLRRADDPWTTAAAVDAICQPGFSTAEATTEIAGRGVGMDVVRSEVLKMGGAFSVASVRGCGLTITLTVPVGNAVVPIMLASASGQIWAIPAETVDDVVHATVETWGNAVKTGIWDGAPFRDLAAWWGLPPATHGVVVVIRDHAHRWAIGVERLQPVQDVAIQPLGPDWSRAPGTLGAVPLSGGGLAPLLDIPRLPDMPQSVVPRRHVLIVDDSSTARLALRETLQALGCSTEEAHDGAEALALAQRRVPDLVCLDVEMPRMDGWACLEALRADPRLGPTPVIMVTTRSGARHRARAAALHVSGYLSKPVAADDLAGMLGTLPIPTARAG